MHHPLYLRIVNLFSFLYNFYLINEIFIMNFSLRTLQSSDLMDAVVFDVPPGTTLELDRDIYSQFDRLTSFGFFNEPISEIVDACDMRCKKSVKKKFSKEQTTHMHRALEWYHILIKGHKFETKSLDETLDFLGVKSLLEILKPTNEITKKLEEALAIPDAENVDFHKFMLIVEGYFDERYTTNEMLHPFAKSNLVEAIEALGICNRPFKALNAQDRIRLAFFISVGVHFMEANYVRLLHPAMIFGKEVDDALRAIQQALCTAKKFENYDPLPLTPVPPRVFLYAKPDIAGLPNWMPNSGNSCYISSTLWSLFVTLDSKIKEAIERFAHTNDPNSPLAKAQDAFRELYYAVASDAQVIIRSEQINTLRTALQHVFPDRFTGGLKGQEDAYEFASCILNDLLQIENPSKFISRHTFKKVEGTTFADADMYDYESAFKASDAEHPSNIIDIRLDENAKTPKTFDDLIGIMRQTEDIERNCYMKDKSQKGHSSVKAHHFEQLLAPSYEMAPDFFCARLTRFSQDMHGRAQKRFDFVSPDMMLQIQVKDKEQFVLYDLVSVNVHKGETINGGHYYSYFIHNGAFYKFDDLGGPEECKTTEKMWDDIAKNGYMFFYKKLTHDSNPQEPQ